MNNRRRKSASQQNSVRTLAREFIAPLLAGKELDISATKKLKSKRPRVIRNVLAIGDRKRSRFLGTLFPRKLDDLGGAIPTELTNDLVAELRWSAAVLLHFAHRLKPFVELRAMASAHILSGEYANARQLVVHQETTCGLSWWTVSTTLLLTQKQEGLQKHRELLLRLQETVSSKWVRILIHSFSQRAEDDISAEEFDNATSAYRPTPTDTRPKKRTFAYLQAALNFQHFDDWDYLDSSLNIEESHSLCDRYLLFVRILQIFTARSQFALADDIRRLLVELQSAIPDPRLRVLTAILSPSDFIPSKSDRILLSILDAYTLGRYEEALASCSTAIQEHSGEFEFYELYAKSSIRLNKTTFSPFPKGSLADQILTATSHIIARNCERRNSLRLIHKLAHQLDALPIADQLFTFYNQHADDGKVLRAERKGILGASHSTPRLAARG